MSSSNINTLQEIDASIKAGDLQRARAKLYALKVSRLPRNSYAEAANLFRRVGLITRGIRLLNGVVRGDKKIFAPTDNEKLEYAVLLVRSGAIFEARELLSEISAEANPDSILYQTFTLTPEWRYAETIPLLKKYIELSEARPYQKLIANVNLIAALIFCGDQDELPRLFKYSIEYARANQHKFLLGSLYELKAQWHLRSQRFADAEESLEAARAILDSTGSKEEFFVEKWRTLLQVLKAPEDKAAIEKIRDLRAKSISRGDWETARDCDFHKIRISHDKELFDYLYCGSPSPSYRARLSANFGKFEKPQRYYSWQISGARSSSHRHIQLDSGLLGSGRSFTELGQAPHRLLILLGRDFYRPQRVAHVAKQLFPDEFFHPESTPQKIHQIVGRLRDDLSREKLSLRVDSFNQTLSLSGIRNCTVIKDWHQDTKSLDPVRLYMDAIAPRVLAKSFSTKEAAFIWDCSVATATRRLNAACEAGHCKRVGSAKATQFQVSQSGINP